MKKQTDSNIFAALLIIFIVFGVLFSFPVLSFLLGILIPVALFFIAVFILAEVISRDSSNPQMQEKARRFKQKMKSTFQSGASQAGRQAQSLGRQFRDQVKNEFDSNRTGQKSSGTTFQNSQNGRADYSSQNSGGWQNTVHDYSRPDVQHPFYTNALHELEEDIEIISSRKDKVYQLLEELFGASRITIERYRQVIDYSEETLKKNLREARKAISLFDDKAVPTPDHKQIIQKFVDNSHDIIESFEKVVLELLELQQNKTFSASDHLDENLDELARTTRYYRDGSAH